MIDKNVLLPQFVDSQGMLGWLQVYGNAISKNTRSFECRLGLNVFNATHTLKALTFVGYYLTKIQVK